MFKEEQGRLWRETPWRSLYAALQWQIVEHHKGGIEALSLAQKFTDY